MAMLHLHHQMILVSGVVSGPKHHYHLATVSQQYLTAPPEFVVTLWDCHIHADAVRALSWIFSMHFLLSDRGSPRLVKNAEVELTMKPQHPTLIGNTFAIQPFLTYCFRRSSYFSNLRRCPQTKFSTKGTVNSRKKTIYI